MQEHTQILLYISDDYKFDTRSGRKVSYKRLETDNFWSCTCTFFVLKKALNLVGSHEDYQLFSCFCPQMKRSTVGLSGLAMGTAPRRVVWELSRNHEPARLAAALLVPPCARGATLILSRAL